MTKRDTRAGSLPYMEAGERMRLSQARLVEARANLRAWRVAAAVWGLTAAYSKAWDAVFIDGLAELTGMDERSVRRGIKEAALAGALQWEPCFQVGVPSRIGLPELDPGPSKPGVEVPRAVEARAVAARLPSYEVVSVEVMSDAVVPTTGTHHSSLIGAQDTMGSEAGKPSMEDLGALSRDELVRLAWAEPGRQDTIRAELARRDAEPSGPFAPWHGDERTGDGIGDDEASQMRWRGANPAKVRARERRRRD